MIDWNKIKLDVWNKRFGEGTKFDLDYGKLLIIGLLIYHIFFQGYLWHVNLTTCLREIRRSLDLLRQVQV